MPQRIGWKFIDPDTEEEYVWPVNPHTDDGSAVIRKSMGYVANAATHRDSAGEDAIGNVAFLRNVDQETFAYSGNVYTPQEYNDLVEWCNRETPIILVDDLGRSKLIYITTFETSRVRTRHHPYKHSYRFAGIVLDNLLTVPVGIGDETDPPDPGPGTQVIVTGASSPENITSAEAPPGFTVEPVNVSSDLTAPTITIIFNDPFSGDISGVYWAYPTPPNATHDRIVRVDVSIKINGTWDSVVYLTLADGFTPVAGSSSIAQGLSTPGAVGNFTWTQNATCSVSNDYGNPVGTHIISLYPNTGVLSGDETLSVVSLGDSGNVHPSSIVIDYVKWVWLP